MATCTKEEIDLLIKAKKGDNQAKETLFQRYEPMIQKISRQYGNYNRSYSLYEDLYQSASEEFMYSIIKFDIHQKKSSFFSYVYGNITFKLRTFMEKEQQHFVYFPINIASKKSAMYRIIRKNPEISDEELSSQLGLQQETIALLRKYLEIQVIYLDAPVKDALSDNFTGVEVLESPEQVEERACYHCEREIFWDTIEKHLSRKEMDVMLKLYNECPMTLDEVGKNYGVTREWIRQIKVRSFQKLEQCYELQNMACHYLNLYR